MYAMNKYLVVLALCQAPVTCLAQDTYHTDRAVLASAGKEGSLVEYKLIWTLGELAISQGGNSYYHLTNGFHQPMRHSGDVSVGRVDQSVVRMWPNPTNEGISIDLGTDALVPLKGDIVNVNGAIVQTKMIPKGIRQTRFDLDGCAIGTYLLVLREPGGEVHLVRRFEKVLRH